MAVILLHLVVLAIPLHPVPATHHPQEELATLLLLVATPLPQVEQATLLLLATLPPLVQQDTHLLQEELGILHQEGLADTLLLQVVAILVLLVAATPEVPLLEGLVSPVSVSTWRQHILLSGTLVMHALGYKLPHVSVVVVSCCSDLLQ